MYQNLVIRGAKGACKCFNIPHKDNMVWACRALTESITARNSLNFPSATILTKLLYYSRHFDHETQYDSSPNL